MAGVTSALSLNFDFLAAHSPALEELAAQSERLCYEDPNAALFRLRQFVECLTAEIAARTSCHWVFREDFFHRLIRLEEVGLLNGDVARLFHQIRKTGNRAVHYGDGTSREALYHLKLARNLAVWYHRIYARDRDFVPGPFVPPEAREESALDEATRQELSHLRSRVKDLEANLQRAREVAKRQREARKQAEDWAKQARKDLARALEMMERTGNENASLVLRPHLQTDLELLVEEAAGDFHAAPNLPEEGWRVRCEEAAEVLGTRLDADDLRYLVDSELREAGWEADGLLMTWGQGTRPANSEARAIAQWPTYDGPASYVLFDHCTPLAPVLIEPGSTELAQVMNHANCLSRDYVFDERDVPLHSEGWGGGYRLPFALATNGRAFANRQVTGRGLWLADLRGVAPRNVPLKKWPTARELRDRLNSPH